jgi:oxygen-independent coproporphyrinogen-3 oxidase
MRNKSRRFLDALLLEIETQSARFAIKPETIYFGGGTPSTLSLAEIEYLLMGIRERLDLRGLAEFTFEINPATVSFEKARLLRSLGVNRISMGVQSWDDAVLKTLGRAHTAAQSQKTFDTLREAGFSNINFDLMFAIPAQTRTQWQRSLNTTIALHPEHVSAYCLTYEEDTEFFRKLQSREFSRDDERGADYFELAMDTLGAAGYGQYEISNYALPSRESQHNAAYWRAADYLGLGPSAFSTVGSERWQNIPNTAQYIDEIMSGRSSVSSLEIIAPATRESERIAFSMRTNTGVAKRDVQQWSKEIDEFRALKMIHEIDGNYVLTQKGKLLADSIAEVFVQG